MRNVLAPLSFQAADFPKTTRGRPHTGGQAVRAPKAGAKRNATPDLRQKDGLPSEALTGAQVIT